MNDQKQKIEFRKVRDFGEVLNVTFAFLRENYKLLGKSILFIVGPFILLVGIFTGLYQSTLFDFEQNQQMFSIFTFEYFLDLIFMAIAMTLITTVTYEYMSLYKNMGKGNFDFNDIFNGVKKRFWMILATGIGYLFMVFFGFLFLVIPGIYLAVALSTIFILRYEEGTGFFESISRCTSIIKHNWWITFALLIVVGVIEAFFSFVFQIPQMIIMFITSLHTIDPEIGGNVSTFFIILSSIFASVSYFFYVISDVAIAFHYYNLVEQKQAIGLMERVEKISEV